MPLWEQGWRSEHSQQVSALYLESDAGLRSSRAALKSFSEPAYAKGRSCILGTHSSLFLLNKPLQFPMWYVSDAFCKDSEGLYTPSSWGVWYVSRSVAARPGPLPKRDGSYRNRRGRTFAEPALLRPDRRVRKTQDDSGNGFKWI